jgi:N-acetylglucosamine-6-sulfatase
MLAYAPGFIEPGTRIPQMVQNIDIAPTILEAAGGKAPESVVLDGRSFLPLLKGQDVPWRENILYEYYWEWNFPATPSVFAIRTDRYKYIYYQGVWDRDGFYDLQTDPHERHNLINVPTYQEQINGFRDKLFDRLEATNGMQIPFRRPVGTSFNDRKLRR